MNIEFCDQVYKRIVELPDGGEIVYNPSKGTIDKWQEVIEAGKQFIRDDYGMLLLEYGYTTSGFFIEFSNDYTKIRKTNN